MCDHAFKSRPRTLQKVINLVKGEIWATQIAIVCSSSPSRNHCPGRFSGNCIQDPSVPKCNWLHIHCDLSAVFFVHFEVYIIPIDSSKMVGKISCSLELQPVTPQSQPNLSVTSGQSVLPVHGS